MRGPLGSGLTALVVAFLTCTGAEGQELLVKLPGAPLPPGPCEVATQGLADLEPAGPDAISEAQRMASSANQSATLGDDAAARAFLREAVRLDPRSADLRYRLGRLLEDTGDQAASLVEYCAYLALDPNGFDADDVSDRLAENPAFADYEAEVEADGALRDGAAAYGRGDFEEAARQFSRAIVLRPEWSEAYFDRALAYAESGRLPAAEADFLFYLELEPEASDRDAVEGRIRAMRPSEAPVYNPGTTLVSGMFVPGMGHFYSGRPMAGTIVLAAAAGSLAAGLLITEVEVRCLSLPVNGECPPGQVESRSQTRPMLVPGLAAALAVTVGGAIHAFLGARRGASEAVSILTPAGLRLGRLAGDVEPVLRIHPVPSEGRIGWGARAEIRF